MVEIRSALEVDSSVHISEMNLRLPNDHSWVVLPTNLWIGSGDGADDLRDAFEQGLIEVRVQDQDVYPDWYLDVLAENVRVPTELLDPDDDVEVVAQLTQLREHTHPAMWAIIRKELYVQEIEGANRTAVADYLQPRLYESGI